MTRGLGDEVLNRCVRVGVEERCCDWDLADIMPKDRPRQFRIQFLGHQWFPPSAPPQAQRRVRAQVVHPADTAMTRRTLPS
ncbi:MAG: hypothetical protein JWQ60_226 [Pseudonocardia sp.]|nr:hypothetical protein [Pseudonocardia sp.]